MKKQNDLYDKIQAYRKSLSLAKSKTKLGKSTDKASLPPSDGKSNDDVIRS
jgi:hypothetical protein